MKKQHWIVLTVFLGALGAQLAAVEGGWADTLTPQFVGPTLVLVGAQLAALFTDRAGKLSE